MKAPRHALESWSEIAARIRRAGRLALLTDFDGTLVPIGANRHKPVLSPRLRRLLAALARSGSIVGIISGRKAADVKKRAGLRGIWYAGAHGFSLIDPRGRAISLASPSQQKRIRHARAALVRNLRGVPGISLEWKRATIAIHYRGAPARSVRLARRAAQERLREDRSLSLLAGKKVWELLPDCRTGKWTAISFLLARERAGIRGSRWLAVFLGDDVTDERVFEQMKGVTVAVGKKRRTAARYFLRSPAEVQAFLERLKDAAVRMT
jgi:trehalose-phosphatase